MRYFRCLSAIVLLSCSMAVEAAPTMYVTNFNGGNVTEFDVATGSKVGQFTVPGAHPGGIAMDAVGNVYVGTGSNTIERFSPTGSYLGVFANLPTGNGLGIAFDKLGNLFVVQGGSGKINEFDSTGANLGTIATLSSPGTIAFDNASNFYVANSDGNIYKFGHSGNSLGVFANAGGFAGGLAFDSSGNLAASGYVSSNSVGRFSPTGTPLGVFASQNLNGPQGMAYDASGNLYVANGTSNLIEEFSASGAHLATLGTGAGMNDPAQMVISPGVLPIPEPGSLSFVGLSVLMLVRKRARLG